MSSCGVESVWSDLCLHVVWRVCGLTCVFMWCGECLCPRVVWRVFVLTCVFMWCGECLV